MLELVDRGGGGSCLMFVMGPEGYLYGNTQPLITNIIAKHELIQLDQSILNTNPGSSDSLIHHHLKSMRVCSGMRVVCIPV